MALSQIQCMDENHVNPRIHESKAEFFYCEEQRLALEVLLRDGREAFLKYLESRALRGFLSDLEQEALTAALEPYDPDTELFSGEAEDEQERLSLEYWPEVSDISIPQMDMGWPDSESYRGVTRTCVYTQPPMEGQAHVKEVIRKMIAQAQKVIAVVMDVFTDIDIFKDLLDAGFKRRVSVYILLERTMLPHFLSMCRRANMHAGHLKHLRVRCTAGAEFYTRHCTKVKGQSGHRFMFIDGDKSVSGSYSFTWTSSRLDRNLITVITGQAVDAFDQLFRFLYMNSTFVDLRQVLTEPEPEPDTRHQVQSLPTPSPAITRKLYNPKYALVALNSPTTVDLNGNDSPKEPELSEESKNKKKRKRIHGDLQQDPPPLHPGLINLEKAQLISYLPTWPEPDPSNDVIGFINIRDSKKPTQVHLQRSEMFETSQAIKFSSPFSKPQETLPEVARPRKQTAQSETKTENLSVDKAKPEQKSIGLVDSNNKEIAPEQKIPFDKQNINSKMDETKLLQTEDKLSSNNNTTPGLCQMDLSSPALPQASVEAHAPKNEQPSDETQIHSTTTLSEPFKDSTCVQESDTVTVLPAQNDSVDQINTQESKTAQKSHLHQLPLLNTEGTEEEPVVSHVSHTNAVSMKPKISSEKTCNLQYPDEPKCAATDSVSPMQSEVLPSKPKLTTKASSSYTFPSTTSPSTLSPSTLSVPALPLLLSSTSSSTNSVTPESKSLTDQLSKKDNINSKTTPEISAVKRSEINLEQQIDNDESVLESLVQISPVQILESVPVLHKDIASETGDQEHTKHSNISKDAKHETKTVTSHKTTDKEAEGKHNGRAEEQSVPSLETQSDVSMQDDSNTTILNIKKIKPENIDSKTNINCITKAITDTRSSDEICTNLECAKETNVTQTYHARCHEPQKISYSNFTLQETDVKDLESLTNPINCLSLKEKHSDDRESSAHALSQPPKQTHVPSVDGMDIILNSMKKHKHDTLQEQACKAQPGVHTSRKTLSLNLSNVQVTDFSAQSNKQELQLPTAVVETPIAKVFPKDLPTTDSRTNSPDPRTPTPDTCDGYFSPREDSTLSTTSEEYFECIESPSHESVIDASRFQNHGIIRKHSTTSLESPFSLSVGTSQVNLDKSSNPAALASVRQSATCTESSTSARTGRDPSTPVVDTKVHSKESKVIDKRNSKEEAKNEVQSCNTNKKEEQENQRVGRTNNKELNRVPGPSKQDFDIKEMTSKLSTTSGRLLEGGMTEMESVKKEPKRMSTGELRPQRVLSEGKKASASKEKPLNQVALTPSNMETRRRQSTKETTGQKPLHPSPKSQPRQQPGSRGSSPSRPLSSSRPSPASQAQGACRSGIRDLNQTESTFLQNNLKALTLKPPPRRSQSRSPSPLKALPAGSVPGRKQVSQSQPRFPPRQPPAAQIRSKPDQPQIQTAKPQAANLHMLSNLQPHVSPHASAPIRSEQAVQELEEARVPFNLSFGRLYNFKGLKDKWTKLPAQSRRSSTGTPVKERNSSS
ncbi:uncharacterized protein LOC119793534 [Cyprinodon tularosa]|uniref:uncharacterized protein LOC119793534 n=1 Tax=Cyprinodon tularosa TaxID=77115 RepID=UPI0018E23250|nr:uncharacterized protein LOC119793534 [Cyprinodon tularosa]